MRIIVTILKHHIILRYGSCRHTADIDEYLCVAEDKKYIKHNYASRRDELLQKFSIEILYSQNYRKKTVAD